MYSLNVPLPAAAGDLVDALDRSGLDRRREDPALVVKRLDTRGRARRGLLEYGEIERRAREALDGAPAVAARVTGVGTFRNPPRGPGPVVYLAVESPGLREFHDRLAREFVPAPEIEGEGYTPHFTLGRGGSDRTLRRLRASVERATPLEWTVSELAFYDARHDERVGTVSLPA